jgi:hypothetical protein
MKHYIGVKEIDAKPMTRGEYNEYRGWTIPADENPDDEGYLVKYPDGYESWSPKKVFEEAYVEYDGTGLLSTIKGMTSSDYQERFKAEYKQLQIRCDKLRAMLDKYFAGELDFKPKCSYNLLHMQYVHMMDYYRNLCVRAEREGIELQPEEKE